jgi:hypothetical protein
MTPAGGRGGSTPPRPPAAKPQQWFVLRPWLFDVTAATWLLRATPRPAQPLPAGPWARAYGLLPAPGGGPHAVSLIGPGPDFDPQYAMTTDLDEPVIIATIASPDGERAGPLLIDGYALLVTVRSEAAAVHWSVSEPVRPPDTATS